MAFRNSTYLYDLRTTTAARSTSGTKQDFVDGSRGCLLQRWGGRHHSGVVLHVALLLSELPSTLQCHFSYFQVSQY